MTQPSSPDTLMPTPRTQVNDTIELKSIGLGFAIEQVYRGLTLTTA